MKSSSGYRHLENWFLRVVLLLCGVFLLWFVVVERDGLWNFLAFLVGAAAQFPDSILSVVSYYWALPFKQLWPSILIGVVSGVLLTYVALIRFGVSEISKPLLGGIAGGAIGSQLLIYPTQHCTFVSDAPGAENWLGILLTVAGVIIVLLPIWTLFGQGSRNQDLSSAGYFKGAGVPALFLFPTLLSLIVFLYFPATEILTTSLTQSNARLPGRQVFVCLHNYTRLVEDVTYRNSFTVTFIITVAVVAVALMSALGIALLASQKVRGAYVYRTLLIWPYALSPVVAGVIFYTMFQQDFGLINYALSKTLGLNPRWFTDTALARTMVVIASVWNILGFNILFYIAGLQNIPRDLLDAAAIDGAGRIQRFFSITLPLLSPFTFFLLVTNVTYSFYGIYGVVDTLTQGGPRFGEGGASGATEVLIYRLYEGSSQAGTAAAQAVILFILIAAITFAQFNYIERRVTYAE